MMAFTFTTVLFGFIGLDLIFLAGLKWLMPFVAVDLIICALSAWYMMAHIIFLQVFGSDLLPVGKPWIGRVKTQERDGATVCGSVVG